jgi:hypothetical protein
MDVFTTLNLVVLGMLLGAIGQGARAVVGIKKQFDLATGPSGKEWKEWFDLKRLVLSLIIGGIAGGLAAVFQIDSVISKQLLIGFAAAGYAGTDFIEGFMKTETPKI